MCRGGAAGYNCPRTKPVFQRWLCNSVHVHVLVHLCDAPCVLSWLLSHLPAGAMLRSGELTVAFLPQASLTPPQAAAWNTRNAFMRAVHVWSEGDNDPVALRAQFNAMGPEQATAAAVELCIPEGDADA